MNGVVITADEVLVLSIRDSVEVLARTPFTAIAASLETRELSRTEVTEVAVSVEATGYAVRLGVLPSDVRALAVPSFGSLDEFIAAITSVKAA